MFIYILSIIILILLVLIGFLVKALIIQVKKNSIYENWIIEIQDQVNTTNNILVELDHKKIFATDDEVGVVFTQIVNLISYLNKITSK